MEVILMVQCSEQIIFADWVIRRAGKWNSQTVNENSWIDPIPCLQPCKVPVV